MKTPEPANPEKLESIKKEILPIIQESDFTERNRKYGQAMAVIPREGLGLLPIKNFSVDRWEEGAKKLGANEEDGEFDEVLKPKPDACSTCLMGCHRRVTIDDPEEYSMDSYGPEYETLGMMGSNCLIDNLLAVNKANELCNRYGLDTIDFGGVCAFAMEAYEKGKIDKDDLGFELNWGDGDAMIKLLHKIAKREGEIPKLLGEGLRPAGEKLGCSELAVEANGAAVPAHDPRAFFSMAVETVTSTRGACHLHGFPEAYELGGTYESLKSVLPEPLDRFATEKKGLAQAKCQDRSAVFNCLPWCRLYAASGVNLIHIAKLLSAITGWDLTSDDLLKAGERVVNLQRMFNLKQGLDPERDDKLPERLMKPPEEGSEIRKSPPLKEMLREYYEVKDWPNGIPSEEKLEELGLDFAKRDLPK